jgi:hypothetical protein
MYIKKLNISLYIFFFIITNKDNRDIDFVLTWLLVENPKS